MFRVVSAVMTGVFVLSAAVQWNDPDPLFWMALYGLAAALSALAATGRLPFALNLAASALFAALAVSWLPTLQGSRYEAFTSLQMRVAEDEEPREAGGLLLCTAWSAVLSHRAWRLQRQVDKRV